VVVAVAVVAASCLSPPSPSSGSATGPSTTARVSVAASVPLAPSSTTTSPAVPVTAGSVASAEEIAGLLPSTPVTTAPAGAVRASVLERQRFAVECFRRYGFEGVIQEDSGILFDVPPSQQDRFGEVNRLCVEEEAEEFGMELGVPSAETLRRHYRAYLYVRECMIAEGYPVDDPPSLEVFVESGGAAWHPYNAFMASGRAAELDRLEQTCPQDLFYLLDVLDFGP